MTTRPRHPVTRSAVGAIEPESIDRTNKQIAEPWSRLSIYLLSTLLGIYYIQRALRWRILGQHCAEPCRNLRRYAHLNRCRGGAFLPGKHAKEGRQTCGASNWKCNRIRNSIPGLTWAHESFRWHPPTDRRSRHVPARLVAAPCPGPGPTSRRRRPWCLRPDDGRSMAAWRRMGTRVRWSGSASSLRTLLSPGVCPASQPRYVASRAMCTAVLCA